VNLSLQRLNRGEASLSLRDAELLRLCSAYDAVMLYGSVARGDHVEGSDIDILAVAARPRFAAEVGSVSLTIYSEAHLVDLARKGSLFVLHLRAEGRVLRDNSNVFDKVFSEWIPPDPESLLKGMRAASAVLDTAGGHPTSRLKVALYILRSVLYTRCYQLNHPLFAMDRVASFLKDERISNLYARSATETVEQRTALALDLLQQYLPFGMAKNNFGSLEALAVSWYAKFPMAADLAVKIIAGDSRIDYARSPTEWIVGE
jgi:predicted nucleotidyltransferase